MPTDNERREVAARLRNIGYLGNLGDVASAVGFADDMTWRMDELNARLADLMEPPRQCPHYHSDRHYCSVHEDVQPIDRDALLALADEMEADGIDCYTVSTQHVLDDYARRIREALGVGK